jgi:hypothetical protein
MQPILIPCVLQAMKQQRPKRQRRAIVSDGEPSNPPECGCEMPPVGYASQSAKALSFSLLPVGCGIVSTHNALALLGQPMHLSVIAGAFLMAKHGELRTGLSPLKLHACIELLLAHARLDCGTRLVELASVGMLRPGTLIYVRSSLMCHFALPNVFDPPEHPFTPQEPESHIVMVEGVGDNTVTVINPDTGTTGEDQQWGRFTVTWDQLYQVWHTTRHDGSTTERVAIILEPGKSMRGVTEGIAPRNMARTKQVVEAEQQGASAQPSPDRIAPSNWPMDQVIAPCTVLADDLVCRRSLQAPPVSIRCTRSD